MSDKFDEIIANGTEDEVEAALADMELSGDVLFSEDAEEELPAQEPEVPAQEQAVEAVVDGNDLDKDDVVEVADEPATETPPESSPAEEATPSKVIERDGKFFIEVSKDNAGLESKNGKHQLPYDLLVGARGETADVKAQLEEQQRLNTELQASFDESKRVSELYSKQLGEAGLDPKLLPEQMLKDPELMAQIKEDYPQIGELVSALAHQLQQTPVQQAPVATPVDVSQTPVEEAFIQSAHLKDWQTGDADRWEMAKLIDSKLASDPSFDNKTPSERFLEVEKRVMNAFGDEIPVVAQPTPELPATPDSPAQLEKAPIPNTPTDIGHQGNDLSPNANLLEQDAGTMAASMESMSEAAIEDLLEGASNFL